MIIKLAGLKVFFLFRSKSVFVSFFQEDASTQYGKLLTTHLAIAISNFKINLQELNNSSNIGIKSNATNCSKESLVDFNKQDTLYLRIFENFFFKPLCLHFNNMFEHISKNEEMYLNYIKFKNLYILDLSSENIIFDLQKSRKNSKSRKYYKNHNVWREIIYHSQIMRENYVQEFGNKHSMSDSVYRVRINYI